MKYFKKILLVVVLLLALASGISKLMLLPDEVAFFGKTGLTDLGIQIFGAIQIIGSLMLPFEKGRFFGSLILIVTFLFSTVLIFMGGNISFGVFSILPIALIILLLKLKN